MIHRLIALLLGRLRMSIDDAIDSYVNLSKRVFSAKQIGEDGKFNAKTFDEAIVEIIESITQNPHEPLLDQRPNSCKVYVRLFPARLDRLKNALI